MATASTNTIYLSNGQVLSVLVGASAAIGTNPTCSLIGAAASTNSPDFQVSDICSIRDMINTGGPATAGQMEVFNVSESRRTGKYIDQITASFAVGIVQRVIPRITFRKGPVYRFIQNIAQVS